MKLLSLMLIAFPIMAQESLPVPSALPLVKTAAPVADSASNPWTSKPWMRDLDQASSSNRTLYRWSVAAVLVANAADVTSSWKNREANPFVAGPTAQFGVTSVAIKSGFVGASLVIQHFVLRHRPDLQKRLAWMNFVTSGALGGVAAHNLSLR
jgi:hypothetical protein